MLILLIFYIWDNSTYRQIHGDILSGEEKMKRKNPFIK